MGEKKAVSEIGKKVGERLGELRIEKRIKQADLGEQLGVTYSTYSYYESGGRELNYERLIKLADYYDVSADYILGRTDDKTPVVSKEVLAVYERIRRDKLFASIFNAYIKLNKQQKQQLFGYVTGLKEKAYGYDDEIDVDGAMSDVEQAEDVKEQQAATEIVAPEIKPANKPNESGSGVAFRGDESKVEPKDEPRQMPRGQGKWTLDTGHTILSLDCRNGLQAAKDASDKILLDMAADPLLQRKECPSVSVFLECDGDLIAYREWSDRQMNKNNKDARDCIDFHQYGYLGRWKDL